MGPAFAGTTAGDSLLYNSQASATEANFGQQTPCIAERGFAILALAAPVANGPRKGLSPPNIVMPHNLTSCPRHADAGRIRKEGYS